MSIDTGLLERELCRIPEVFAARIVTDGTGQPTAARILASPRRPPTRVRRDVQSVALASFGIDLDASAITITQLDQTILANQGPQPQEATEASPAGAQPTPALAGQPPTSAAPSSPSEEAEPQPAHLGPTGAGSGQELLDRPAAAPEGRPAAGGVGPADPGQPPPAGVATAKAQEVDAAQAAPDSEPVRTDEAEAGPDAGPRDQPTAAGPATEAPEAQATQEAGGPGASGPAEAPSGLAQLVGRLDELIAAADPSSASQPSAEEPAEAPTQAAASGQAVVLERVTTSVFGSRLAVEVTLSRGERQATRRFEGSLSRAIGARLAASAACAALAELDVPVADLEAASVVPLGDQPAALAVVVLDSGQGPATRTGSASVGPAGEHQAMALAVLQAAQST